ncbi:phage portal protein [Vagococcus acidifermentans]|uniref:Phage portal protein n=2 Tax=Vagococcus acidifermentans TaxID=564710 RepID=A0A430B276_9ENTE|nr:phage portal protein [Vagococcus acidifermentans]
MISDRGLPERYRSTICCLNSLVNVRLGLRSDMLIPPVCFIIVYTPYFYCLVQCSLSKDNMPQADNSITKLLNEAPNSEMDGWHFKFALAVNMLLNGNSFAEIKRKGQEVISIELLPNSLVTVKQNDNGVVYYVIGEKKRKVKAENILHFKYFTQDGLTGVPPLYALRDEMKVQSAGNKTIFNFFSRGINGSGILKVNKSDLDTTAKRAIREKFEEANGSSDGNNALRTIILDETMDYKTLEVNTDVLKLINSSDWTTKQIAKAFGISSERLGVESVHSSTIQSNLMYLQNTLVHYFSCFISEISKKLGKDFRFNTDRLMETDPETIMKNTLEQVRGSLLTINEGRAKLGLPPQEGGDRLLASLNYTYLDSLESYQFREQEGQNGTRKKSD